jgi:predicted Zn-dependent protease
MINKKNPIRLLSVTLLTIIFLHSCSTVPFSGRKQLTLLPETELVSMSMTAYSDFMRQNQVSGNTTQTRLVKDIGNKISTAAAQYLQQQGLDNRISGYNWEFNLINDPTPNAWAMPGGKIVVYEGILPYTKTTEGLAVVIAHEIAHVVARHGNERMSQALLVQTGGLALQAALSEKPQETQQLFMAAYGVGTTVGISLPYSRSHEYEADYLGLIFMAIAGYNPNNAIDFWERMADMGGASPPEYLSTHPSDENRIANIQKMMPEVMQYYKR